MVRYAEVVVLTEGQTEQRFIKQILAPYMGERGSFLTPIQLEKRGQKGGDIRFARAKNDIAQHLKQRSDTCVTLLVDYYGIGRDWPGLNIVRENALPQEISTTMCTATQAAIDAAFSAFRSDERFVPHFAVHEFEALLFSDPSTLASFLGVKQQQVASIIEECGEPEAIDNSPQRAPSKRIERINGRFKKTSIGIDIAEKIGIEQMRSQCPVFNGWLKRLESLAMDY